MTVNLYTLTMNLETTGTNNAVSQLQAVETVGKTTAATLNTAGEGYAKAGRSLGGFGDVAGSTAAKLDLAASAALNGTKGFRDLTPAYENQASVLASLGPKQDAVTEKMEKGTKAAKEHDASLGGLWHTVKSLGEAWLVFEAIDFAKDAIEDAAALHELSQKTGASVEMLSILEFAGKRANVSAGDLAMGFRGLGLSLGNLRDGQDKTVQAFKTIGLTFEDFKGLNTDEAFKKIVVALGQLPDGLEKSEVAARVFGRSGALLIPLLDDLAHQGFQAVTREAEKFHAVIGEKLADDADKLKDKAGDLHFEFQALAREVIPPLNLAMATLAEQLSNPLPDLWRNTLRELAAAVDGVVRAWTGLPSNLQGKYEGDSSGGANWELNDTGISPKGAGQRNRGQGLTNVALSDEEKERIKRDKEQAKEWAAQHRREMLAIISSWEDAPKDLGSPLASTGPMKLKGSAADLINKLPNDFTVGNKHPDLDAWQQSMIRQGQGMKDSMRMLGTDLGMLLANGFAQALAAGIHGKNPFKVFGNVILAGLGSIMASMGQALIAYGVTMLNLLPFLTNIFTSGPAAIAAGVALTALGLTLGGLATGGGSGGKGGGSSAPKDTITQIHLTSDGAGGFTAPKSKGGDTYNIFGANDPQVHRQLAETVRNAKRSGHNFGRAA